MALMGFFIASYVTTGNWSHVISVTPLLRDHYPRHCTNWATTPATCSIRCVKILSELKLRLKIRLNRSYFYQTSSNFGWSMFLELWSSPRATIFYPCHSASRDPEGPCPFGAHPVAPAASWATGQTSQAPVSGTRRQSTSSGRSSPAGRWSCWVCRWRRHRRSSERRREFLEHFKLLFPWA